MPANCKFAGGRATGVLLTQTHPPQGNQGCVLNPSKGNWMLGVGVQVGAGDSWEALDPPPLFYGRMCVPSEHMGACSQLYSQELIPLGNMTRRTALAGE